jgi:hypothetical protein
LILLYQPTKDIFIKLNSLPSLKMTEGLEARVEISGKPEEVDISDLTEEELQLVNKGRQNYGNAEFMEYIFPAYIDIKQEYGFPNPCLKLVVKYPKNMDPQFKPKFAASFGNKLREYKRLLDHNRTVAANVGMRVNARVTVRAIRTKLAETRQEACHSPHTHLYSTTARHP